MNSGFQKVEEKHDLKMDNLTGNEKRTEIFNKLEYWLAVEYGFDGTPSEWMEALKEISSQA